MGQDFRAIRHRLIGASATAVFPVPGRI